MIHMGLFLFLDLMKHIGLRPLQSTRCNLANDSLLAQGKYICDAWNVTNRTLAWWLECSLMARKTWVQSQVYSYQRLKKWYLILLYLTLSNKRYVLRVKWNNPGKGVALYPTPRCSSYWKGSLLVALDFSRQLSTFLVSLILIFHTSGLALN